MDSDCRHDNTDSNLAAVKRKDFGELCSELRSELCSELCRFAREESVDIVWDWNIGNKIQVHRCSGFKLFGDNWDDVAVDFHEWQKYIHPNDLNNVNSVMKACAEGQTRHIRLKCRIRAGNTASDYKWILCRGSIMKYDNGGKPARIVGTAIEINAMQLVAEAEINKLNKELERRVLERTSELESTIKEVESFDYSISHDLRAPLRSINGFSHILMESNGGRLDDEGRECLRHIIDSTMRMGQLIDGLLTMSKLGREELHYSDVDLSDIVNEVSYYLRMGDKERNVELAVPDHLMAKGDRRLLYTVIENLMGNAWKFTRSSPAARIEFGLVEKNDAKIYYIKDNGVGFDMAYANKLFKPFQRLHKADEFEGSGIGLANVQRIIKRHKGKIWAEGAIGKGAAFYFTLPD